MEIGDFIERIIERGKIEDMYTLSDILEEIMNMLKEKDEDSYKIYSIELYKMAYGNNLTKELAEEIVSQMRPRGEHWSFNQASEIKEKFDLDDIRAADFYVVMNSAYNDYYDIFDEDLNMYVKFTIDFIKDEDAKDGKVLNYFI